MGRWLSALRARNFSEKCQTVTVKTDKTPSREVLSVSSLPVRSVSQKSAPGSVGFVSASPEDFQKTRHTPVTSESSPEDWDAFFHERAGIREFDGGLRRTDAEAFALQDTIAALGPRPAIGWR